MHNLIFKRPREIVQKGGALADFGQRVRVEMTGTLARCLADKIYAKP